MAYDIILYSTPLDSDVPTRVASIKTVGVRDMGTEKFREERPDVLGLKRKHTRPPIQKLQDMHERLPTIYDEVWIWGKKGA